jgi:alanine dehydrogenase/PNT-like protein
VRPSGFGAAYGYAGMGHYRGAQAQRLRVPFADANCVPLPGERGELAMVQPGSTVAVFGAGTAGLLAAYSALLRGAGEVYVVDHIPDRLDKAGELGATPVDFRDAGRALRVPWATFFSKGVNVNFGRTHDRRYTTRLCDLVVAGRRIPGGSSPTTARWTTRRASTTASTGARTGSSRRSCSRTDRCAHQRSFTVLR